MKVKELSVEEVTEQFNLIMDSCPDGLDRDAYLEGVYQTLFIFCPVDSPSLSTLILLKIEAQFSTLP